MCILKLSSTGRQTLFSLCVRETSRIVSLHVTSPQPMKWTVSFWKDNKLCYKRDMNLTHLQQATGLGRTTPAVYTAWNSPLTWTRLVISLINTGATRFDRSFLWTHRKFISTMCFFLQKHKAVTHKNLQYRFTENTVYQIYKCNEYRYEIFFNP
jgi:hypothetical protein